MFWRSGRFWVTAERIAGGVWVLSSGLRKANPRTIAAMPREIEAYADQTTITWYGRFLKRVVVPRAGLFARLAVYGVIGVGGALALGLCTRFAALMGIFMHANYLLAAGFPANHPEQAQNGALILIDAAALATDSGRHFGVDALLGTMTREA